MIDTFAPSRGLVSSLYRLAAPGEWVDRQEAERRVKARLRRLVVLDGAPMVVRSIAGHPCRDEEEATTRTVLMLKVPVSR